MEMETAWMDQMKWTALVSYYLFFAKENVSNANKLTTIEIASVGLSQSSPYCSFPFMVLCQHPQALLIVCVVSFPVWTPLAVSTHRPAVMDESSVPPALMRRVAQPQRVAWTLTGPVETASVSLKSCTAMGRTTVWTTLMKRTVVRKMGCLSQEAEYSL